MLIEMFPGDEITMANVSIYLQHSKKFSQSNKQLLVRVPVTVDIYIQIYIFIFTYSYIHIFITQRQLYCFSHPFPDARHTEEMPEHLIHHKIKMHKMHKNAPKMGNVTCQLATA